MLQPDPFQCLEDGFEEEVEEAVKRSKAEYSCESSDSEEEGSSNDAPLKAAIKSAAQFRSTSSSPVTPASAATTAAKKPLSDAAQVGYTSSYHVAPASAATTTAKKSLSAAALGGSTSGQDRDRRSKKDDVVARRDAEAIKLAALQVTNKRKRG
jgi:hypothetical protein